MFQWNFLKLKKFSAVADVNVVVAVAVVVSFAVVVVSFAPHKVDGN